MKNLIIFLAIIAAAYWYWSGPYQKVELQTYEEHLKENADIMKRCITKEASMAGAAGMAGLGGGAADAETLCAQENNLYRSDGQWHSKNETEY